MIKMKRRLNQKMGLSLKMNVLFVCKTLKNVAQFIPACIIDSALLVLTFGLQVLENVLFAEPQQQLKMSHVCKIEK